MRRKKLKKLNKTVHDNQKKYDALRRKAYQELFLLETYFGKRQIDQKKIYTDILLHLEAAQKELSYAGHRGVFLGLVTGVLLYAFNTKVLPVIFSIKIPEMYNFFVNFMVIIFIETILFIAFFVLYFVTTGSAFWEDKKRRNQIYINEYLIKLVELKIKNSEIDNKKTYKDTDR